MATVLPSLNNSPNLVTNRRVNFSLSINVDDDGVDDIIFRKTNYWKTTVLKLVGSLALVCFLNR